MNYIDIIILILLLLAAISGYRKGLVVELASLAALILGIWGAFEFSDITAEFLVENFNWHWKYLNIVSFILTFIVIVILVHVVGSVVNKIVETAMLGFLNRLAGIVFGILKSALVPEDTKAESKLYQPLRNFVPSLFPFIEEWVDDINNENSEEKTPDPTVV